MCIGTDTCPCIIFWLEKIIKEIEFVQLQNYIKIFNTTIIFCLMFFCFIITKVSYEY